MFKMKKEIKFFFNPNEYVKAINNFTYRLTPSMIYLKEERNFNPNQLGNTALTDDIF